MRYSEQVRADAATAIERIKKLGWIQKKFGEYNGPCCSLGHIYFACEENTKRELALATSFRETIGDTFIIAFNDSVERTKKDVVSVFRRIISAE